MRELQNRDWAGIVSTYVKKNKNIKTLLVAHLLKKKNYFKNVFSLIIIAVLALALVF